MMRSTAWARFWSILRLVMGAVIGAAIVAQLSLSLTRAAGNGQDVGTVFVNFFSFFTILSNSAAAVVLVWAALWYLWRGRNAVAEPLALALALSCVTAYMIVTGIVY